MSARALRVAAFAIAWMAVGTSPERARAQVPTPPGSEPTALPSIHEWKLKNGLTVAHVERPGLPMVTVQVWYRFGSADEPARQHGAARAFERLMDMGSGRVRSEDHRHFIEQAGGETSAIVTEDVSAFHNAVPVERFELPLELEADRMRGLMVRAEALDDIRPTMVDEVRRQESNPVLRAYHNVLSLLFTLHPYSSPPIGVAEDIEKLTSQQVKALYDAYFVPANALVVVVGGVSTETATKAVERWFGPLAAAAEPSHVRAGTEETVEAERRQVMSGSPIGVVMAGYRLPPATDPDVLALQVASSVLTGGTSSRLYRRLVRGKLADEVGGQVLQHRDGGVLIAFARFGSGGSLDAVDKALLGEIERLAAQGPSAAELRRAKGQILGSAWFGMESASGLANQIGLSWGLTGQPAGFLADLAALDKLGAAQVKRAAEKYLARNRLAMVLARPVAARPAGGKP